MGKSKLDHENFAFLLKVEFSVPVTTISLILLANYRVWDNNTIKVKCHSIDLRLRGLGNGLDKQQKIVST
jgi:hypothetical protein